MNIECDAETLTELEHAYKFNDAVIRHLIVNMNRAATEPSPMMKEEKSRTVVGDAAKNEGARTEAASRPDAGEKPAPVEAA
jgi:small subunit ribosomal protein S6